MDRYNIMEIFKSAIMAADPYNAAMKKVRVAGSSMIIDDVEFNLGDYRRIVVVGAGKATAAMARALEEKLDNRIDSGAIIVKYGHTQNLKKIRQIEGGHPIPDMNGVEGTREIIDILKRADEKTLVFCLLSGGASALLVSPSKGISLNDKQNLTELLLKSGAAIDELNAVRKHVSGVKGGRLAEAAYPASMITLILSDVIGDRLDVIASGPTVPDSTTFKDAVNVIERYDLEEKIPGNIKIILKDGLKGMVSETPKGGEEFFKKNRTIILGSIKAALNAARDKADSMGFDTQIITSEIHGEARKAAIFLSKKTEEARHSRGHGDRPKCILSGGETTVTVKGKGLGGRNQELALAFAGEIEGKRGITMLSAGTDGTDGPTDAAGAIVDGETMLLAGEYEIEPSVYLMNNDSYNFFRRLDSFSEKKHHLITGPTGTNVMDIQIIIVEG